MRISKILISVLLLSLISKAGYAAAPEYAKPINAYQSKYDMSFFVWKPIGLHSKWYATYDGYPVTEIANNLWVYGVFGSAGQMYESITAVGSVDPNTVHILTPLPSFLNDKSLDERNKFHKSLVHIFETKCDNFSIVHTKVSPTPIAWESKTSRVFMWGGERWIRIFNHSGEKFTDTINRSSHTVANMLKTCKIIWTQFDTFEFANFVKSAGLIWVENFEINMPISFKEASFKTGSGSHAERFSGNPGDPGNKDNPDNPDNPESPGNGGWDTGRDK
ncbi:MAG: hypothetical protein FWF87_03340 [Synergistaceae bacterium]|nr:hypothetical protein [Synergistaceae bacterium]